MNESPDGKLVALTRAGSREAYAVLTRRYSRRVFAICLGLLGRAHDAEDAAQEVLLRGFVQITKLRDGDQFGAWISRIARNLCVDFLRRRKHRETVLDENAPGHGRNDVGHTDLEDAVAQLREEYRVPLMLYYFDGHDGKGVAEILGVSTSAVHTRISRARQELRKLLEQGGV